MKAFVIAIFDFLFSAAWLGLVLSFTYTAYLFLSFIYGTQGAQGFEEFFAGGAQALIWATILSWTLLAIIMFLAWVVSPDTEDNSRKVWFRILCLHVVIAGPTAFYLGSLRPSLLGREFLTILPWLNRHRLVVDSLYYLSFWGSVMILGSGLGVVIFAGSIQAFQFMATILLVALPLAAVSTFSLDVLLLIDAVRRGPDLWSRINVLKMLNPWAWAFGARKYYLSILRPNLFAER